MKKLSVLIPIYNWDISLLFHRLTQEITSRQIHEEIEIIFADDLSTDLALRHANRLLIQSQALSFIQYVEVEKNLGRSKIRNFLANAASGEFLLFLDCDTLPDSPRFIRTYLFCLREENPDLACGGISYHTRILKDEVYDFYLYFSQKTDARSAQERSIVPWTGILTSNLLVKKSLFLSISFDEDFKGYGYEDVEWGIRALKQCRKFLPIDNTVSHLGLIEKKAFYLRMRSSISNYQLLSRKHPEEFNQTRIRKYKSFLSHFKPRTLRFFDRRLRSWFLKSKNNPMSYWLFQMNKAVLFSLESQTAKN